MYRTALAILRVGVLLPLLFSSSAWASPQEEERLSRGKSLPLVCLEDSGEQEDPFSGLPVELVLFIFRDLSEPRDIGALSAVNTTFNVISQRVLETLLKYLREQETYSRKQEIWVNCLPHPTPVQDPSSQTDSPPVCRVLLEREIEQIPRSRATS